MSKTLRQQREKARFNKEGRGVKHESKRNREKQYKNNADQNPTKTINKLKYNILSIPNSVLLNLSAFPFPWGWYGVVLDLSIQHKCSNWLIIDSEIHLLGHSVSSLQIQNA